MMLPHKILRGQGKLPQRKITPRRKLPRFVYTMFNLRATMRNSAQDNVILNTTHILSRVLASEERRRSDEFGFSGSERRRQPERLQTCYGNHNAVRIRGAYFGLPALINFLHILQWG